MEVDGIGKMESTAMVYNRLIGYMETRVQELVIRRGAPLCFMPDELYKIVTEAVEGVKMKVKELDGTEKTYYMARNRTVTAKVEDDIKEFIGKMILAGYANSESEVVRLALRLLMLFMEKLED